VAAVVADAVANAVALLLILAIRAVKLKKIKKKFILKWVLIFKTFIFL
jgi:hypothetical protein